MRWLLMATLFGAILGTTWLVSEYRTFQRTPLAIPAQGLLYGVIPGTSLQGLAADLHSRGILQRPKFLIWTGRIQGLSEKLRAGEYQLTKGITPLELLELLVSGKVVQHSLTIVEGWTFGRLMEAVDAHEALVHTLQDLDDRRIMARLGYPDQHPEGLFFPETYSFPRGMSDLEFLRRAYDAMERKLATAWAARAPGLPLKTPYEALILASIVERETGLAEERSQIAGVFIRRLKQGMLLQTDPTVIYGIGKDFDGNIRRRDLLTDTPYNTYTRAGLPPTPIALPGGTAIDAVMRPASGDTLYFVARGDGSHYFSRTLQEHNQAVARFQLRRRK